MSDPTTSNISNASLDDVLEGLNIWHYPMCLKLEHEEDSSIPDDCSCGSLYKAKQALTAYLQQECLKSQTNAVAWIVGLIDKIHENAPPELDKEYKGLKNTIRDAYEIHTGIDPAPSYPVNAKLKDLNQGGEAE